MQRTEQILRNEAAEQVRRFRSFPAFPAPGSPELEELTQAFMQAAAFAGRPRTIGDRLMKTLEFSPRPKHIHDAAAEIEAELTAQAAAIAEYKADYGYSCALCDDTGFAPKGYGSWVEAMRQNAPYREVVLCKCRKVAR